MLGQTISHYKILEKIGEGGMGVVYKARDIQLDRLVALKFLATNRLQNPESRQRFIREAKAAAALDHPNICTVFEIGEAEGQIFIAMAYLEGKPLSDLIDHGGPLKIEDVIEIAAQAAEGLEAAHRKGVFHRDIKPANLIVLRATSRSIVKIMDFGLARLAGASKLTRHESSLGTVGYMSPEQAQGRDVDATTDIWALGVVLYEMATGKAPFRGEYDAAVLYSLINEHPQPLTVVRGDAPSELGRITNKCLAKDPRERHQAAAALIADLRTLQRQLELGAAAAPQPDPARPQTTATAASAPAAVLSGANRRWDLVLVAAVVAVMAGVSWWVFRSQTAGAPRPVAYRLSQMTRDEGQARFPALSPDGKLLAYSSDRGGDNQFDVWVQQVAGGEPIRLTRNPALDVQPSFSPDGNHIVFFSERDGGGVYLIPSLGGSERLLTTDDGQDARFSPDGKWVSYAVVYGAGDARLFVIPVTGGASREVNAGLPSVFAPIWSPDSRFLVFSGNETAVVDTSFRPGPSADWYAIPVEGGEVTKLGVADVFRKTGILDADLPRGWASSGTEIVFEADGNVWKIPVSTGDWRIAGPPQRLTAGTGEYNPSSATDGRVAFATRTGSRSIWFLPMDANSGRVTGRLRRVTYGTTYESFPVISRDGKRLVLASDRNGTNDIWLIDLETGEERAVVITPADERRAVISPDGSRLAFQRVEQGRYSVYVAPITGGPEVRVCEHCRSMLTWSPDGESLIVSDGTPESLATLNVATLQTTLIAERQGEYAVFDGVFSPDGAWFAFDMLVAPGLRPIYVVSAREPRPVPQEKWIKVADDYFQGKPWWSPDGNLLYFYSRRDNFECIWAQRLDPATKQPRGDPFAVRHLHDSLRVPNGSFIGYGGAADGLYLVLEEARGNIWLAEPQ